MIRRPAAGGLGCRSMSINWILDAIASVVMPPIADWVSPPEVHEPPILTENRVLAGWQEPPEVYRLPLTPGETLVQGVYLLIRSFFN